MLRARSGTIVATIVLLVCTRTTGAAWPALEPLSSVERALCRRLQRRFELWSQEVGNGCHLPGLHGNFANAFPLASACSSPEAAVQACHKAATVVTLCFKGQHEDILVGKGGFSKYTVMERRGKRFLNLTLVRKEEVPLVLLAHDLAYFSSHVGRKREYDSDVLLVEQLGLGIAAIAGHHQRRALLSDRRNSSGCARTRRLIEMTDATYRHHGFRIAGRDRVIASFLSTSRNVIPLPQAFDLGGCSRAGAGTALCECLGKRGQLEIGAGILDADVELFVNLSEKLPRLGHIFVIGNAFGYSSILLGLLTKHLGASIDVIDAEAMGKCSPVGSWLTRKIASASSLDIKLTKGWSPRDVPMAMRAAQYDFAFIDGAHTDEQLSMDFAVVEPRMAAKAIVVLHDVGFCGMHKSVEALPVAWQRHHVRGRMYKNLVGTLLLHRGFPSDYFDGL